MGVVDVKRGLCLPGYACTSRIWKEVREVLKSSVDCELVDWPDDGKACFDQIEDYARWVSEQVMNAGETYDFIVGHSMGGLVALHMAQKEGSRVRKVILVESFITSPGPFFQNLMMDGTSPALVEDVTRMLKEQQPGYAGSLQNRLRELDLTDLVLGLRCDVAALYGDRGCHEREFVLANLQWSDALREKVEMNVVPDACHFPMLENPGEFGARLIGKIVGR